jgi:hypothetical protein
LVVSGAPRHGVVLGGVVPDGFLVASSPSIGLLKEHIFDKGNILISR